MSQFLKFLLSRMDTKLHKNVYNNLSFEQKLIFFFRFSSCSNQQSLKYEVSLNKDILYFLYNNLTLQNILHNAVGSLGV